jgi:hypothetical protein
MCFLRLPSFYTVANGQESAPFLLWVLGQGILRAKERLRPATEKGEENGVIPER